MEGSHENSGEYLRICVIRYEYSNVFISNHIPLHFIIFLIPNNILHHMIGRDFYIYISSKTLKPSIHAAVCFLIIFHKTWSQLSNIENRDVFLLNN